MIWRTIVALLLSVVATGATAQQKDATPLFTPEDLSFLSHMIVHHEQALELTALVPSRTHREDFIRFARYVDGAQRVEIDQMKSLLQLATERGMEIPHHDMSGDPPMAGMLSKAQMAALAAASGAPFERLWLEGMIYHHEGALDMGRVQQQRQFESGHQPYGLDVMVDDILVSQRAEITKMKTWLTQWSPPAPPGPVVSRALPKPEAAQRSRMDSAAAGQLATLARSVRDRTTKGSLCALLSGASSVDRTRAAQVAAEGAGTQLYRVDLSSVVSKYANETEKHLSFLFERATAAHWILFFDEADELFGRRTDVRDSHDRYANLDTASLLQRIERYDGLVLLSSNLPAGIDARLTQRCASIRVPE